MSSKTMSTENTSIKYPFNLYDFFGYIFPGAYMGLMFALVAANSDSRLFYTIERATAIIAVPKSILNEVVSVALLIVIAYALGHIVATASHIFIDRLIVSGILGYPSDRQLGLPPRIDFAHVKRSTSIYIAVLGLGFMLTPVYQYYTHSFTEAKDSWNCLDLTGNCNPLTYKWICWVLVVLFIAKVLHAALTSDPYNVSFRNLGNKCLGKIFVAVYTFPAKYIFRPLISVMEVVLGTNRKIPDAMVQNFQERFRNQFKFDFKDAGTENYWLPFFSLNQTDPSAVRLLFNWLHIYGFSRNMAMAAIASLWYILYRLHSMEIGDVKMMYTLYVLNFLVMIVFLARYWMIYSTYYTKSIFRAYIAQQSGPMDAPSSKDGPDSH